MIRSLVFRFGQTLFMFLTILGCVTAQDKVPLNGQSGINLSYQLTKLEESDKRDRYNWLLWLKTPIRMTFITRLP